MMSKQSTVVQPKQQQRAAPQTKSGLRMMNNIPTLGVDLEDTQVGIPKQAYEYQASQGQISA